jgi:outer membrane protein OmpA-like peptidoglycan-associated protein
MFAQAYKVVDVSYLASSVKPIEQLNTPGSEFSPIWYNNNTIVFTSSREFDLLAYGENNWKNSGKLNVYKAEVKEKYKEDLSKFKTVKIFSEQIVKNTHTGPVCFSVSGDTMFFTQTLVKNRKFKHKLLKPQLFMAVKSFGKWGNITLLPFNNPDYSFGHPSYDSKTQTLYFSSDIAGGKGGKDIYSAKMKPNGDWEPIKNISHLNTASNELFPFYYDKYLFFASDKEGGKGGLDLYWVNVNQNATVQSLDGANTEFDDFGMSIIPGREKGLFSSNRNGSDDLFLMDIKKQVTISNELAGKFTYRNLGIDANNLKIMLVDEDGNISFETITSENGEFKFRNLDLNTKYSIKTLEEEEVELFIYDKDGNVVAKYLPDSKNKFTYKKLNYNAVNTLALIPEDYTDFKLETGYLTGQIVYANEPGKYPNNLNVVLKDEKGQQKFNTNTDERGNFDFKNLSLKESYILTIPNQDDDYILLVFDKEGNVVAQLKSNKQGEFIYRKLNGNFKTGLTPIKEQEDEFSMETKTIAGNFNYRQLEGHFDTGLTVYIYNDAGILIATETTNEKGEFRFRNLPINDNFLFKIEENGTPLNMEDFELFLEDRFGKKIAQLQRGENGYFIYKPLGLNIETNLTQIEEDSLGFELEGLSKEHEVKLVYFDSNKEKVKSADLKYLNEIITKMKANPNLKLEINAYADSRSSDEYNLILSGKRGKWITYYLVNRGISKERFIVNAYGESRLAVDCVDCTEEQNAKNRRAELRLY